ncbi:hypothetical protein Anapl_00210 [Anas platyrhynchos]|uniref:Uncharacterized protein n=1 Tax=Anas platyrhynchos TaxID=8839 RepID=R0LEQ3_ANAPL|nr:hypothetical protein Anapl_00210 [Anas platyrhynchos]
MLAHPLSAVWTWSYVGGCQALRIVTMQRVRSEHQPSSVEASPAGAYFFRWFGGALRRPASRAGCQCAEAGEPQCADQVPRLPGTLSNLSKSAVSAGLPLFFIWMSPTLSGPPVIVVSQKNPEPDNDDVLLCGPDVTAVAVYRPVAGCDVVYIISR